MSIFGEDPDADDDDEEAVFAETGVNKLSRLVFAVLLSDAPLLADTAEPGSTAGAGAGVEAELDEVPVAVELAGDVRVPPGNKSAEEDGKEASTEGEVLPKDSLMMRFICSLEGAAGAAGRMLTRVSDSSVFK